MAGEGRLRRIGVDTYAQNLGVELLEPGDVLLQDRKLRLSGGREGQREEEQNHVLLPSEVPQRNTLLFGALAGEIRCLIPNGDHR